MYKAFYSIWKITLYLSSQMGHVFVAMATSEPHEECNPYARTVPGTAANHTLHSDGVESGGSRLGLYEAGTSRRRR